MDLGRFSCRFFHFRCFLSFVIHCWPTQLPVAYFWDHWSFLIVFRRLEFFNPLRRSSPMPHFDFHNIAPSYNPDQRILSETISVYLMCGDLLGTVLDDSSPWEWRYTKFREWIQAFTNASSMCDQILSQISWTFASWTDYQARTILPDPLKWMVII